MTEHCINNGSSICQTKDATHLILTYKDYKPNKTVGFTYSGEQAELMLHLKSDPEVPVYRMSLYVTNFSNQNLNVLIYNDPHDNTTDTTLMAVPPKDEIKLYSIREFKFSKKEELVVFFRLGDKVYDVDKEELQRLYKCLSSIHDDPAFSDMTMVNDCGDEIRCHRAVIAAATDILDENISTLELVVENRCDDAAPVKDPSLSVFSGKSCEKPDLNMNKLFDDYKEVDKHGQFEELLSAITDDDCKEIGEQQKLEEIIKKMFDGDSSVDFQKHKEGLMQLLRDNIQEIVNIPTDNTSETKFMQPDPKNYKLIVRGLQSKNFLEEILRFIYTGEFKNCSVFVDDLNIGSPVWVEKIDEILCVVYLYNLSDLADIIQTKLISKIAEHTVIDLLQLAKQYNLEKLKLKVIRYLRNPTFLEIAEEVKNVCVHKCIISKPEHKFTDQIHFRLTQMVSELEDEEEIRTEVGYFCGVELVASLYKTFYEDMIWLEADLRFSENISFLANINITVVSKKSEHFTKTCQAIIKDTNEYFIFQKLMLWNEFEEPENGFVVNDTAIFKIFVEVLEE